MVNIGGGGFEVAEGANCGIGGGGDEMGGQGKLPCVEEVANKVGVGVCVKYLRGGGR